MNRFSRQFTKFPERLKCWPQQLSSPPPPPSHVGWGLHFLLIFWTAHDISPTFVNLWPPKTPLRLPWGGSNVFLIRWFPAGSIRICMPNLVAIRRSCRKKGGYRQTHTQRDTAALYIVDAAISSLIETNFLELAANDSKHFISPWQIMSLRYLPGGSSEEES